MSKNKIPKSVGYKEISKKLPYAQNRCRVIRDELVGEGLLHISSNGKTTYISDELLNKLKGN